MGIEYLQVDVGLPRSPKVTRFARLLSTPERRVSRHEAAGLLVDLWSYAAIHFPKGALVDVEDADIELDLAWDGKPGLLVEALRLEGFLHKGGRLAGWDERYGAYLEAKDRAAAKKRQQRLKAQGITEDKSRPESHVPGTVPGTSPGPADHKTNETNRDEQRQDETNDGDKPAPEVSSPAPSPPATAPALSVRPFFLRFFEGKEATREANLLTVYANSIERAHELAEQFAREAPRADNPAAWLKGAVRALKDGKVWTLADPLEAAEREQDRQKRERRLSS